MDRTHWFADNASSGGAALGVTLSETTATTVDVTAGFEGGVSMSASRTIAWIPTYIDGDSAQSITIRRGDSLLLTAWEEGGTTLEIDDGKGGGFQTVPGGPGATLEVLYDTASDNDDYLATARIDLNGDGDCLDEGEEVGSLIVIVIDVDLSSPIACQVGYKREKFVPIKPSAHANEVVFGAPDPFCLGDVSVKEYTSMEVEPGVWKDGAMIYLRALRGGMSAVQSRINGPTGPVVAEAIVEGFTIDTPHYSDATFAVRDDNSAYGSFIFQINPWPIHLTRIEIASCAGSTVNGQQVLDLTDLGGDGVLSGLDENGRFEGVWELDSVDMTLCTYVNAYQASTPEFPCGGTGLLNPRKCAITVRGGLYLARELSDETERQGKDNLEHAPGAEPDDPDTKQIYQVWDRNDVNADRWTSAVKAEGLSSEQLEAAFFYDENGTKMPSACRPSRWYTSKVIKNDCGAQFATSLIPYYVKGGAQIDDNETVDRDEVTKNAGACAWLDGKPDAIPGNVPASHYHEQFCYDHSQGRRTYDSPFTADRPLPRYVDHGFLKGNMIGSFDVIAAAHAVTLPPIPRDRVSERSGTHGHTDVPEDHVRWAGDQVTLAQIIRVGRLEADGYTAVDKDGDGKLDEQNEDVNGNGMLDYADDTDGDGVPDAGGEDLDGDGRMDVKETDTSSRDRFADVVGANVYEYEIEGETGEIDSQTQQPVVGDMTYVRTNHEDAQGTADPVPVHITFRAPPGEQVKAAVTISTSANKKTWKAWVALTDNKIFEYRGRDRKNTDGSPLTDDQKADEVYDVKLDADGNYVDDGGNVIDAPPKAERVVTLDLTADDWFADGIVYVYGIEASAALDDLKLAVWGEERMDWKAKGVTNQEHRNQNLELVDEEPLPIKRWYITDEEPLNVLKIDIVGHWPGTMAQPGAEVSEQDEDDPDKLMVGVNDDDDNRDEVVDNDRASSSTIAAEDDEILTFTLTCADHEGQVELSVQGSGIRIFDESGQNQIPVPATVDLASPSGPLAGLASGSVTVRAEADTAQDEAKLVLRYLRGGSEICRDEVSFAVASFEILGGFTRGASPIWGTAGELLGTWYAGGNIGSEFPLFFMIPGDPQVLDDQGKIKPDASVTIKKGQGAEMDGAVADQAKFDEAGAVFDSIIAGINAIIELVINPVREWLGLEPLEPLPNIGGLIIATHIHLETGIAVDDLMGRKYFMLPDPAGAGRITEPGADYVVTYRLGENTIGTDQLVILQVAVASIGFEDAGGGDGGDNEHPMFENSPDHDGWGVGPAIDQPAWKDANLDGDVFDAADGDKDFPACYTRSKFEGDSKLRVDVGLKVSKPGMSFDLIGYDAADLTTEYFRKNGVPSTGDIQAVQDLVASCVLPDHIAALDQGFVWRVVLTGPEPDVVCFAGKSAHRVYVTLDDPITETQPLAPADDPDGGAVPRPNAITERRLVGIIKDAQTAGLRNRLLASLNVRDWLADRSPPIVTTKIAHFPSYDWLLLSLDPIDRGFLYGECAEQAILMSRATRLLGIPSHYFHVRGSTDANCLDFEPRPSESDPYPPNLEWLWLDYSTNDTNLWTEPAANPQQGQGTCSVPPFAEQPSDADYEQGNYFSVYPKRLEVSDAQARGDLRILHSMNCIQIWSRHHLNFLPCAVPALRFETIPPIGAP